MVVLCGARFTVAEIFVGMSYLYHAVDSHVLHHRCAPIGLKLLVVLDMYSIINIFGPTLMSSAAIKPSNSLTGYVWCFFLKIIRYVWCLSLRSWLGKTCLLVAMLQLLKRCHSWLWRVANRSVKKASSHFFGES